MSKKIFIKVKPKEVVEKLSSYDKAMENYVSTKKDRILEVTPIIINNETFYKDEKLDYWYFTEEMIETITKEDSLKEISDLLETRKLSIIDVIKYEIAKCEKIINDTYSDIFPLEYGNVGTTDDIYKIREDFYTKIEDLQRLLSSDE